MEKKKVKGVMRWLANLMMWVSEDVESRLDTFIEEVRRNSKIIYTALMEAVEDDLREDFSWVAKSIAKSFNLEWATEEHGGEGGEVQEITEGKED